MAATENKPLLYCSVLLFVSVASASTLFDHILNDVDPCEDVCQKTYPSHAYEKGSIDSCLRGCRFYSIIELVGEADGVNGTLKSCHDNCKEAYGGDVEGTSACDLGCDSQKPVPNRWGPRFILRRFRHKPISRVNKNSTENNPADDKKMKTRRMPPIEGSEAEPMMGMMYPLLYMHNMYSNMFDKVTHHMSVSWSFFMQDGTGRLVVIKSQPQAIVESDGIQDFDDYSSLKMTSRDGLETNIEASDNTATQVLRHAPQMKSVRSLGDELNLARAYPWSEAEDNSNSDWLTCIARKTGLPRLLLSIIILLSAVAMIWLCMSAAVTAPDHKISQQKLSINGDLEYVRHLMEKKGIKAVHPQDFVEARPLPVKLRIEKL